MGFLIWKLLNFSHRAFEKNNLKLYRTHPNQNYASKSHWTTFSRHSDLIQLYFYLMQYKSLYESKHFYCPKSWKHMKHLILTKKNVISYIHDYFFISTQSSSALSKCCWPDLRAEMSKCFYADFSFFSTYMYK